MKSIFDDQTTTGKAAKVLIWTLFSTSVMALLSSVTSHPELFSPTMVMLANVVLVTVKNLLDPRVPNV